MSTRVLDSFEDQDVSEYSGSTGDADFTTSPVEDGSVSLQMGGSLDNLISRTDKTIATGETPFGVFMGGVFASSPFVSSNANVEFVFGVQEAGDLSNIDAYSINFIPDSSDVRLEKFLGGSSTVLDQTTVSQTLTSNQLFEVRVTQWTDAGDISADILTQSGTNIGTVSATDTAYTSGGFGFGNSVDTFSAPAFYDFATKTVTLSAPSNVTTSVSDDDVTISWDAASGASSYNVFRAQSSGTTVSDYPKKIATVTDDGSASFSHTDTGLEDGEKFYYRVESVN